MTEQTRSADPSAIGDVSRLSDQYIGGDITKDEFDERLDELAVTSVPGSATGGSASRTSKLPVAAIYAGALSPVLVLAFVLAVVAQTGAATLVSGVVCGAVGVACGASAHRASQDR